MSPAEALGFLRGPTTREFLYQTVVTIASRTVGPGAFTIADVLRSNTDRHAMFKIAEQVNQPMGHAFQR